MSEKIGLRGHNSTNADIDEAASNWFTMMQSDAATKRDADDFKDWYDADPDHQKAYQGLEKLWEMSGGFTDKPEIQALRKKVLSKTAPSPSKSRFPFGRGYLLSFALAAILIAAFLFTVT